MCNILKKAFREVFKSVDEPKYEKHRGQKNMLNDTIGRQSGKSRLPKVYKTNDLIFFNKLTTGKEKKTGGKPRG